MRVFIDFEASSLGKKSFPIEVAWVFEDGTSKSMLIQPIVEWRDWSPEAEALHGISRDLLEREGVPAATVAHQMMSDLIGHDLFASAPSWDGKWLSTLLRGGGLPRHALRLSRTDEMFLRAARDILGDTVSDDSIADLIAGVIATTEPVSATHRALPDAGLELQRFHLVREEATKRAALASA
ncbi:hypothetical protein [Asticcacaulis sp.]|uniref:hypothetical protein n=1 Tax=Asticcacaulis sp. TaxID=1872648 RepID=UPI003F7BF518